MITGENYLDPFECHSCGLPDSECICDGDHYDSEDYRRPCKYATEGLKDILPDIEHSSTPFTAADIGRAYINS